jgi:LmbE family N-acetylglucosaminyl deacetylase
VIAPHPDDEVAGCGGVILLHAAAGDQVTVLHVTDGRGSRLGLEPGDVARLRRAEADASLAVLGVHRREWLGLPEWEWRDQDLIRPLQRLLGELAPDVVYLPSRVDFHPEHRRVAVASGSVLGEASNQRRMVRVYQVQVPLTRALANLVAPIGSVFPTLLCARDCYASQEASLRAPIRLKHYVARAHHLPGVAEEFWEMTAAAYAVVEQSPPAASGFRALRRLALTDPLAFLVGRAERRRLHALVPTGA